MVAGSQSNPNGQANSLTPTEIYQTILDEVFQQESKTTMWTPNSALVQGFQHSKTGRIPTITASGLGNYDMVKGYPQGTASLTFQDYTLRYDRGVQYLLDSVDVMQSDNIPMASAVLSEMSRTQVVPEVDAVRIASVVERAKTVSSQVKDDYTPAKGTMLSTLLDGLQVIEDNTGIDSGINILINTRYGAMLKQSTEVTRTKNIESGATTIGNKVTSINDNPITYVPSARMFAQFDLADGYTSQPPAGAGFKPHSGAEEVVAVMTAPNTAMGITAHQVTKLFSPDVVQDADGSKINFRVYHDCIVPKNKIPGIYVITAPVPGP